MPNSLNHSKAPDGHALDNTQVWRVAISTLESKLKPQNFDLWFRPITCTAIDDHRITLVVPNRFIRDWFENHYLAIVLEEIRNQTQRDYQVSWQVHDTGDWPPEKVSRSSLASQENLADPVNPQGSNSNSSLEEAAQHPLDTVEMACQVPSAREYPELLSKYTFETFVVGPSNQLAEAAARAVAENPAGKYNPLFIYGGVGLGKTHLLHGIGHQIHKLHPSWRIVYLKTETFMNEYINLVRNNRIEEFRAKYREEPDILLMDDIQYLGGKERTQDEFFHTFNALFESHRQIVVTADKYPHEIPDLEERIRSRFQWGLIADIQPPELETRMAILAKKAEYDKIDLPNDVAYYLASHIKSNVRELEGLLIRVAAFASLQQRPITVEFAQETLKNFLSQAASTLTVETVQKEVASYFNIKVADLKSPKRHQSVARPRQIAMYLARKLCKASYPDLGQRFGGKDHTTVLSACRKIESMIQDDIKVRHIIQELERHLSQ